MKKAARICILILVLLFVVSMLFSGAFLLEQSDHGCIGDECTICMEIRACEDFLRSISLLSTQITVTAAIVFCCLFFCGLYAYIADRITLITLKVKLSA